jgi:hypothetical protein
MKQGFVIVFSTVIVFAAGYGVRVWTEGVRPIPAVPVVSSTTNERATDAAQRQRAQIVANIQRWTADSGVFSKGVAALDSEFETAFNALLTPRNQQARIEWAQSVQSRFNRGGRGGDGRGGQNQGRGLEARGGDNKSAEIKPMSDEEFERLRRAPLGLVARMLAVDEAAELRRQQFALDEEQLARTKALLSLRRDKFIALTSGISAMSIQYSALALELDRLTAGIEAPDTKAAVKEDSKATGKSESGKSEPAKQ